MCRGEQVACGYGTEWSPFLPSSALCFGVLGSGLWTPVLHLQLLADGHLSGHTSRASAGGSFRLVGLWGQFIWCSASSTRAPLGVENSQRGGGAWRSHCSLSSSPSSVSCVCVHPHTWWVTEPARDLSINGHRVAQMNFSNVIKVNVHFHHVSFSSIEITPGGGLTS